MTFHVKHLLCVLAFFCLPAWAGGETVTFPGAGIELKGRLYRPEGRGPFPAIVLLHGCSGMWTRSGKGAFVPGAPLLILAGEGDDWTPAAKCAALQRRASDAGAPVELEVYDGAHHAFDRTSGQLRYRPDVRNPSSPTGWGAHMGPHPEARRKALDRATAFLQHHR